MGDLKTQTTKPAADEGWFITIGREEHGPFDTLLLADKWARENLEKGKTYSLEKRENFL